MSAEAKIREALAAGPTPGEWISDSECGLYAMNVTSADGALHISTVLTGRPARSSERAINEIEPTRHGEGNRLLITACNPAAMTELLAEFDRARANSERYLWLRKTWCFSILERLFGIESSRHPGAELDSYIDAARTPKEPDHG